ncbi:hypothetical protein WJX72_003510 [[Myrmecia] bisecta]|uniref:ACT domain-containing protein n=1 Tax=[Myrmecia] bisecta TaxID=41462 RepID=A0AAW1R5H7_9CHLO
MNSLLLKPSFARSASLQTFSEYKQAEACNLQSSVSHSGELLEYETLELRVHPPNINIDNGCDDACTVITVDSANRPGTLVEVVQHFTELGLDVKRARISSDGGWFVDVFEVTESSGEKVRNTRKLDSIKEMLNVSLRGADDMAANGDETDDAHRVETTVFELAGQDKAGLLADVTQLLTHNGCNVRSAAVWTYKTRVAFVLSVTEKGQPIQDGIKLQRLRQLLFDMMDNQCNGIVNIKRVRGEVHHDRRLHVLMLKEEEKAWVQEMQATPRGGIDSLQASPADSATSLHGEYAPVGPVASTALNRESITRYRSPKHSKPDVHITPCGHNGYWLVTIKCKDRNKLLFDTVCTLADLDYDVYHATIDSQTGMASQEYYIKPRLGPSAWCEQRTAKLAAMLESSIQRRFPKGLKVHVHSVDRFGCLAALTRVLKAANLSIMRAKVKTYAVNNSSGHTFYVMDASGDAPDRAMVEAACSQIGGKLVESIEEERSASSGNHKFSFSFLNRQWTQTWNGNPSSPCSSNGSS